MPRMLVIPAETHPTDHSFLEEVHARADGSIKRTFLMRTREQIETEGGYWHQARLHTFTLRSYWTPLAWLAVYFADLRYVPHVLRLAREERPDLVYVRDLTFPLLLALLLRPFYRWRVIYQKSFPHELRWFDPRQTRRYRLSWLYWLARRMEVPLLRELTRRADAVLPISEALGAELVAEGACPVERVHAFGMGVCDEARRCALPPDRRAGETLRLVYVGTLAPGRKLEVLLDAIHILRQEHGLDVRLTLFGGRPDEIEDLQIRVSQMGLRGHVEVPGRIARGELYGAMARHHAGAIFIPRDPRFRVASVTKLLESLTIGLPCVCTDAVAMHHTLHQDGAAVILTDDSARGFANGILELDERWQELSRSAHLGREAIFDRYSYPHMRNRMDHLLESLREQR